MVLLGLLTGGTGETATIIVYGFKTSVEFVTVVFTFYFVLLITGVVIGATVVCPITSDTVGMTTPPI